MKLLSDLSDRYDESRMENQNFDQYKEILKKYSHSPPSEALFEINKNIKQLTNVLIEFERKKGRPKNAGPPNKKKLNL